MDSFPLFVFPLKPTLGRQSGDERAANKAFSPHFVVAIILPIVMISGRGGGSWMLCWRCRGGGRSCWGLIQHHKSRRWNPVGTTERSLEDGNKNKQAQRPSGCCDKRDSCVKNSLATGPGQDCPPEFWGNSEFSPGSGNPTCPKSCQVSHGRAQPYFHQDGLALGFYFKWLSSSLVLKENI